MISKPVLPLLALALAGCTSRQQAPQPIPALAERASARPIPASPKGLLTPPVKTDFLHPTG